MNSKEVVAGLKAKREEAMAIVQACNAALAAFGEGNSASAGAPRKRGKGMQAAHDAMAVKRGTATPEQRARWEKRQAKKGAAGTIEAATPAASLVEAAG